MKLFCSALMLSTVLLLNGCSSAQPDMKSPCVSGANGPCDRRPANAAWPA